MFKDSIANKFSRSWEITKSTFQVMWKDKEILLFTLLSSLFSIILFLLFIFPIFISKSLTPDKWGIYTYFGIFGFYFVTTFVAVFFNVGIVHIARTRFAGGDATFGDGIKTGFKHLKQILGWSLLSATVGVLLNLLQGQARKQKGIGGLISSLLVSLIGLAWAIVSIFVVPAIVLKNEGPIDALKSSAKTIKKTWGESLIRHYGLGLVQMLFSGIGVLFFLIPGILIFFSSFLFGLILIGLFFVYLVILAIVFSSAKTVFNTALFIYADTGKVPGSYSSEEMKHAFIVKK